MTTKDHNFSPSQEGEEVVASEESPIHILTAMSSTVAESAPAPATAPTTASMLKVEPSSSAPSSSANLVGRSRTTAKEAVSSRWASRAETSTRMNVMRQKQQQQQQQQQHGSGNGDGKQCQQSLPPQQQQQQKQQDESMATTSTAVLPESTNNLICQTWRQIQKTLGRNLLQSLAHEQKNHSTKRSRQQQQAAAKTKTRSNNTNKAKAKATATSIANKANKNNTNTSKNTTAAIRSSKAAKCPIKSNANAEMLANTITKLYVTNALQIQLETFTKGDYDDDYDDDNNSNSNSYDTIHGSSSNEHKDSSSPPAISTETTTSATTATAKNYNYLKSVLSILPAGFDETSALMNSVQLQQRKRAFLLLDLGRVISAHATFLSYTCGFTNNNSNLNLPPTHRLVRRRGAGVNSIGWAKNSNKNSSTSTSTSTNANNKNAKIKAKASRIYIQPQFSVTKNPNVELLKLLVRLGVDLRCNSSDDVIAARAAMDEERRDRSSNSSGKGNDNDGSIGAGSGTGIEDMEAGATVLVDDASKTRKPNGYFRRFLQTRATTMAGARYVEVAVDGVDEVVRISAAVRRFQLRAGTALSKFQTPGSETTALSSSPSVGEKSRCRFMLRLPCIGNDSSGENGVWERLILNVYAAAKEEGGELYGVSVDISSWSQLLEPTQGTASSTEEEQRGTATAMLNKICTRLRLFRLLLLSVGQYHIRIDLTGLPTLTREHCKMLTQTLSNIVSSDVTLEELMQVHVSSATGSQSVQLEQQLMEVRDLANDPENCSLVYTADISTHLVARAGALCTRVIGVKSKDSMPTEKTGRGKDVAIHYFIDDGCYGSLTSSCSQKHIPVPLYGNTVLPKSKAHLSLNNSRLKPSSSLPAVSSSLASSSDGKDTSGHVLSTVWGPTCDGLDKVCELVLLPKNLEANKDWLVFSNLGCGGFGGGLGLGTAFNGFDPPDVSYCVLGYFSGGS